MSHTAVVPFEVGGLRFDVSNADPELVAFIQQETENSWAQQTDRVADLTIELSVSEAPDVWEPGTEPMFGIGENAIFGKRLQREVPTWGCQSMTMTCRSPTRITLSLPAGPLPAFVALYRVISTTLKARILAAGGGELHASAVFHDGQIVAFVGPKGAGKTSLCMDFVLSQNWSFVANDHVLLKAGTPAQVVALPETLRIGFGTVQQHAELRGLVASIGRGYGDDGKTRIYLSEVASLLPERIILSGALSAIVVCAFDATAPKGGTLSMLSLNDDVLRQALVDCQGYVRPAWLEFLDVGRSSDATLSRSLENIPILGLRRARGDTYAAVRLARAL
ncbi:hypothetical protein [Tateyamaria sp. ANG-S1]|uniref:hypothetical protein n=1 Tax=Tateyamaria sp. ANG-S1 TaxID=1577905 RepID=UPI00057C7E91|nr:hypothetical protein [Tateyamaria sp. ANG-S1]KIC48064.1 hypothetical protein RA29_17895 [Tateyamaria sp. ANG-S1]